jgi:hypothetical protein
VQPQRVSVVLNQLVLFNDSAFETTEFSVVVSLVGTTASEIPTYEPEARDRKWRRPVVTTPEADLYSKLFTVAGYPSFFDSAAERTSFSSFLRAAVAINASKSAENTRVIVTIFVGTAYDPSGIVGAGVEPGEGVMGTLTDGSIQTLPASIVVLQEELDLLLLARQTKLEQAWKSSV